MSIQLINHNLAVLVRTFYLSVFLNNGNLHVYPTWQVQSICDWLLECGFKLCINIRFYAYGIKRFGNVQKCSLGDASGKAYGTGRLNSKKTWSSAIESNICSRAS